MSMKIGPLHAPPYGPASGSLPTPASNPRRPARIGPVPATYLSTRQVGSNNDVEFNDYSRARPVVAVDSYTLESVAAALDAAA